MKGVKTVCTDRLYLGVTFVLEFNEGKTWGISCDPDILGWHQKDSGEQHTRRQFDRGPRRYEISSSSPLRKGPAR